MKIPLPECRKRDFRLLPRPAAALPVCGCHSLKRFRLRAVRKPGAGFCSRRTGSARPAPRGPPDSIRPMLMSVSVKTFLWERLRAWRSSAQLRPRPGPQARYIVRFSAAWYKDTLNSGNFSPVAASFAAPASPQRTAGHRPSLARCSPSAVRRLFSASPPQSVARCLLLFAACCPWFVVVARVYCSPSSAACRSPPAPVCRLLFAACGLSLCCLSFIAPPLCCLPSGPPALRCPPFKRSPPPSSAMPAVCCPWFVACCLCLLFALRCLLLCPSSVNLCLSFATSLAACLRHRCSGHHSSPPVPRCAGRFLSGKPALSGHALNRLICAKREINVILFGFICRNGICLYCTNKQR